MTTTDVYIDASVVAGGDGTIGDPYGGIVEWEANDAKTIDLADTHHAHFTGGQDLLTATVTINGYTVNGHLIMDGDATSGSFNTSDYYIDTTSSIWLVQLQDGGITSAGLCEFRNMQFRFATTSSTNALKTIMMNQDGWYLIDGCWFDGTDINASSLNDPAIEVNDAQIRLTVTNTVFQGYNNSSSKAMHIVASTDVYLYNNLFYDCDTGINSSSNPSGTFNVVNNIVVNCATDTNFTSAPDVQDYNCSDASFGTNHIDASPGTEADDWDDMFTDRGAGDFSIKDTSSVQYRAGLTTASDSIVPTIDVIGNTFDTGAFLHDVGPFAFVTAASGWSSRSCGCSRHSRHQ